jgi:Zn-dependent protease
MSASLQDFEGQTFLIGSVNGIRVHVHYFLPVLTVLYSLSYAFHSGGLGFALGLVLYGPLLFGSVFLHELGHCLAAKKVGGCSEDMLLWPLGGLAFYCKVPSVLSDLKVAVAGPLTHIPLILLSLALLSCVNKGSVEYDEIPSLKSNFFAVLCWDFMMFNIMMIAFNLFIPCYPLDGGKIFIDTLLLRGVTNERAAQITVFVSVPIFLLVGGLGLFLILSGNPAGLLTVCVALFFARAVWDLHRMQKSGTLNQHPLFRIPLSESN